MKPMQNNHWPRVAVIWLDLDWLLQHLDSFKIDKHKNEIVKRL